MLLLFAQVENMQCHSTEKMQCAVLTTLALIPEDFAVRLFFFFVIKNTHLH